ncbi:glycosyltransferase family 4 protein [Tolypothrix sp. VBCCA 56010]|uniref:glycosyltransferase family 4 protein n=1 Tax=Tolypothrix sp. VBCCA 56010 TaxID=3137731 RepID=UPI003D7CE8DC
MSKAMRIAIVRRALQASLSMDVYADGLVSGLKTVRPDWEILELAPIAAQKQKRSSLLNGLGKYYQRYWHYPQTVKKQEVDIFHVIDHSDGHLVYWLKNTGKPIIVTCHDLINFLQPENVSSQAIIPSVSMAAWKYAVRGIRQANRIITVSAHTAKDAVKLLDVKREDLIVVPNAVESIFYPLSETQIEVFRRQHHISPETICLLNVGSNQPRKNVFTILKALGILKEQKLPFHFWKAGADFTVEQKQFIQTHNLEDFVSYLGKPDKSILVQLYNAADVLIAPSVYEGFGMTILEAMACGTAVITSNVTSLPEVAGDAAILVNPTDVLAIAKAVRHLYEDSSYRQSLVEQGLARVKLFSWEQTAEKVAQVYEKVIGDT